MPTTNQLITAGVIALLVVVAQEQGSPRLPAAAHEVAGGNAVKYGVPFVAVLGGLWAAKKIA